MPGACETEKKHKQLINKLQQNEWEKHVINKSPDGLLWEYVTKLGQGEAW